MAKMTLQEWKKKSEELKELGKTFQDDLKKQLEAALKTYQELIDEGIALDLTGDPYTKWRTILAPTSKAKSKASSEKSTGIKIDGNELAAFVADGSKTQAQIAAKFGTTLRETAQQTRSLAKKGFIKKAADTGNVMKA